MCIFTFELIIQTENFYTWESISKTNGTKMGGVTEREEREKGRERSEIKEKKKKKKSIFLYFDHLPIRTTSPLSRVRTNLSKGGRGRSHRGGGDRRRGGGGGGRGGGNRVGERERRFVEPVAMGV